MDAGTRWGLLTQEPFGSWMLDGRKTVETREYELPAHLVGHPVLILTSTGKPEASTRILGEVVFGRAVEYETREQWAKDAARHCVDLDDPSFGFRRPKFGWPVLEVRPFAPAAQVDLPWGRLAVEKRSIVRVAPGDSAKL